MAKCRIAYANLTVDAGTTMAASAEAAGYAVENLQNHKRSLAWRSDAATGDQTVTASFAAASIVAVGLIDAVIHAGGSVKVEAKNGGGSYAAFGPSSGVFSFPSTHRSGVVVQYDTGGVTATDVRITFTNTGAVAQAVELGGLWVVTDAGLFIASTNITDSYAITPVDLSSVARTIGGQRRATARATFDRISPLDFLWASAAQKDALLAVWDAVQSHTPILLALDPDDANSTRLVTMQGMRTSHGTRDQWHVSLPCDEEL